MSTGEIDPKKVKRIDVFVGPEGEPSPKKPAHSRKVDASNYNQEYGYDVYADLVSDGASKIKVSNFKVKFDEGTIPPPVNKPPVSKPGQDQIVSPGDNVTLNGSESVDPDNDKLTYQWTQVGGSPQVQIINKDKAVASFVAPDPDQPPPPPQLNAKLKELIGRVDVGKYYIIDGSASTGNVANWSITQADDDQVKVTLEDASLQYSKKFVMPDTDQTLHFTLVVVDPSGQTDTDSQTVSKNISQPPPPPDGEVLWDSNNDGKWNNGVKRTVTGTEGSQAPNGKGIFTAASGDPKVVIDGNGVAHLVCNPGHGRFYTKATNYNSRLEFDFMFEDQNVDNISFKLRSRHNMGGACSFRFGGFGGAIDRVGGGFDFKTESCHNNHENSLNGKIPSPISSGKWYRLAISVWDNTDKKQVNLKGEIDYKDGKGWQTILTGSHKNPQAYYVDEASFMTESYFWLRINNEKTGFVAFKDVRLTKIPATKPMMKTALQLAVEQKTLTFRLKVTDQHGSSDSNDVKVIVGEPNPPPDPNQPKASLIGPGSVPAGSIVQLDATGSSNYDTLEINQIIGESVSLIQVGANKWQFMAPISPSSNYTLGFQIVARKGDNEARANHSIQIFTVPPETQPGEEVRFLVIGDNDQKTVSKSVYTAMKKFQQVKRYIHLGDTSYDTDAASWISIHKEYWQAELDLWRITKGNHDCNASEANQTQLDLEKYFTRYHRKTYGQGVSDSEYLKKIRNNLWLEYEQVGNVFIINMDSEDLEAPFERAQFKWVTEEDLPKAKELRASGQIDWVVVLHHRPFFTMKSSHDPLTGIRFMYMKAFIDAQVDFIIHGHNHNTQLWYPMIPNQSTHNGEGSQLFEYAADGKTFDFAKMHGWATIVSGHGSHEWNEIIEEGDALNNVMHFRDSGKFGFTELEFKGKDATIRSHDTDGTIHHEYKVTRRLAPLTV